MLATLLTIIALFWAPPDDPEGRKLLERVCGHCHKLDMVTNRHLSREAWQKTVQAMVDKGADASDEEFNAVIDYLAKYYGPSNAVTKLNVNKATASEITAFLDIPESHAQAIVRYREAHGNFKVLQDLEKVPGLDAGKIEARKDRLEF